MLESFSAVGFFVHTPCGPRKSGIPDSVEMPAPVSTTTRAARLTQLRTFSMSAVLRIRLAQRSGFCQTCPTGQFEQPNRLELELFGEILARCHGSLSCNLLSPNSVSTKSGLPRPDPVAGVPGPVPDAGTFAQCSCALQRSNDSLHRVILK